MSWSVHAFQEALNWLMDEGQKFMADNAEMFASSEEAAVELALEWSCPKCTFENAVRVCTVRYMWLWIYVSFF